MPVGEREVVWEAAFLRSLTHRPAADNRHLALLLLRRHDRRVCLSASSDLEDNRAALSRERRKGKQN